MKLVCLEITEEFLEALNAYNEFLDLGFEIERFVPGSRYKISDEVIFIGHNHTPEDMRITHKIVSVRNDPYHCAIPLIFVSEKLSEEVQNLYGDKEFVWECLVPFDSNKFLNLVTEIFTYKAANQDLLQTRTDLQVEITRPDYEKAEELIFTIEAAYPNLFNMLLLKGVVSTARGQYLDAELFLEEACTIKPHSFEANSQLAKVYHLARKFDEFEMVTARTSKAAEIYVRNLIHWGNIYLERGEEEKSMGAFERALEKDKGNVEATEGLLAASLMSGKLEMAQKVTQDSP
ncbi:MAG: hypothetical protein EOP06_29975, partial [Proteobacteria bacterium]